MLFSSFLVLALVRYSIAKPTEKRWDDLVEKHAWANIPKGWEFVSYPPSDHVLDMRIALKQHKIDELINTLYEVSDPNHAK
jgi:tripeptidyl-peptidase I